MLPGRTISFLLSFIHSQGRDPKICYALLHLWVKLPPVEDLLRQAARHHHLLLIYLIWVEGELDISPGHKLLPSGIRLDGCLGGLGWIGLDVVMWCKLWRPCSLIALGLLRIVPAWGIPYHKVLCDEVPNREHSLQGKGRYFPTALEHSATDVNSTLVSRVLRHSQLRRVLQPSSQTVPRFGPDDRWRCPQLLWSAPCQLFLPSPLSDLIAVTSWPAACNSKVDWWTPHRRGRKTSTSYSLATDIFLCCRVTAITLFLFLLATS